MDDGGEWVTVSGRVCCGRVGGDGGYWGSTAVVLLDVFVGMASVGGVRWRMREGVRSD